MKKRISAGVVTIAVLMGNPLAFAATAPDVKLYGRVGVNAYHLDADDQSSTTVVNDKSLWSRIGVLVSQDIGNGMTGFVNAAWAYQPTDVEAFNQQRDTHIGIRGDFGQIAIGAFHGAYKVTGGVLWDPLLTTPLESRRQAGMGGGAYAHNAFLRRMVEYRTPNLNGFRATIQYGLDRRDTSVPGSHGDINLGLTYDVENLQLIGAYATAYTEDSDSDTNWKLGARWTPGPWTLAAQYEDVRIRKAGNVVDYASITESGDDRVVASEALDSDMTHLYLQASYRMGRQEFHGIVGHMEVEDLSDRDITALTLGYTFWFTPNTRFLGGVQFQDRESAWASGDLTILSTGLRLDF